MSSPESLGGNSVLLVQLRWKGTAGGGNGAVVAQVQEHLAVMVGSGPNTHGGQAEARVRPGIGPFDGVEHVLRADGAERFADRGERIAQVNQQFFFGFRRAGAAFVTGVGRLLPVEFGGKPKIAAGHVLDLLCKCAHFGGTKLRLLVPEFSIRGTVAVFLFGHGFRGGAYFLLLVEQAAQQGGRHGFVLAYFRSSWLMLLWSILDTLILEGLRLVGPLPLYREGRLRRLRFRGLSRESADHEHDDGKCTR